MGKGTKTAFSGAKIQLLIAKAVRTTDSEVEKVMNDWLRYAKDRDGGRMRRTLAKTPTASPERDESETEKLTPIGSWRFTGAPTQNVVVTVPSVTTRPHLCI
ncbi:hypothetical protein LSAT2_020877 [Lamellibrachia satsuma]|nr:hypothetical protein LSAT2_020877 [Lamellibrachia satsuma]